MDLIWSAPDEPMIVSAAAETWENYMLAEGININDPAYGLTEFRTKGVFKEMFRNYLMTRKEFFQEVELISVERPFAVPIRESADIFYVGRLDKVFRRNGRVFVSEHKTTSMYAKQGNFRTVWVNSFSPNSQIDGYSYAGHLLYPDEFKAVWVDAALVHKTVHDAFKWIPLERRMDGLELWLWETNDWVDKIQNDLGILRAFRQDQAIAEISNDFMPCFPRSDPTACIQYNRECTYKDLIPSSTTPLKTSLRKDGSHLTNSNLRPSVLKRRQSETTRS
jgi:hypothetical protein